MSSNGENQDIYTYLNPNYWDKHTLGVGEYQNNADVVVSYSSSDSRFAKDVIAKHVRSHDIVPKPKRTYYNEQVFNPAVYQPGTVVLFRQEVLYGSAVPEDMLEELTNEVLPQRPTATSPSFGSESPRIRLSDKGRRYSSDVIWGVVPRSNDKNYISSIPASCVVEKGTGVRAQIPFIKSSTPIVVGETVHSPAESGRAERLVRNNILHIITFGTVERKKRKIFSLAVRAAFSG